MASFSPHKEEIYCPPVSSEKTSSVGEVAAAAAAKSLQLCLTLCDPLGSPVDGIYQARILQWVAVFSFGGSSQTRDQTLVSFVT